MRRIPEIDNINRDLDKLFKYFYGEDEDWIAKKVDRLIEFADDLKKDAEKLKKRFIREREDERL